jgi:hypothetical protein
MSLSQTAESVTEFALSSPVAFSLTMGLSVVVLSALIVVGYLVNERRAQIRHEAALADIYDRTVAGVAAAYRRP